MAIAVGPRDRTLPGVLAPLKISPGVLVGWLVVASGAELLILRTFTRIAIHIPGLEAVAGPYRFLAETGRLAYYTAAVLVIASLAMLAVAARRAGGPGRLAPWAVAAIAFPAALIRGGPHLGEAAAPNTLMLAGVALAAILAWLALTGRGRLVVAAIGLATVLSGWYTVAQGWDALGIKTPAPLSLVTIAEYGAVAGGLASPLLVQGPLPRRAAIIGVAVAALVFAVFAGNPATTRILLLWSHGLSGSLPSVAYAAAAGMLAAAIAGSIASGRPLTGLGLLLLLAGGIGLQNTYQTSLVAAGFLAIASEALARGPTGADLLTRSGPAPVPGAR